MLYSTVLNVAPLRVSQILMIPSWEGFGTFVKLPAIGALSSSTGTVTEEISVYIYTYDYSRFIHYLMHS